jgi:Tfp pilus assembly major pilin PilA
VARTLIASHTAGRALQQQGTAMDSNSAQNEELYRAAVGDSKAGYYLPLFYRFDQGGGRISWNWPALFVPLFWMIYRRMYGLAAAYFFLYPLALVILLAIVSAVVGEATAALSYWLILIGGRVLIAMFANALYHWRVRKRIDNLAAHAPSHEALVQRLIGQSSGNAPLVAAVVVVGSVFLIGILAAISIPAYQDYTIRSQISEGLVLAAPIKASVAQAYAASGSWPADVENSTDSARYVSSIEMSDGAILIRYGKAANSKISGQTLSLHPRGADGGIEWDCGYAAGDAVTQTQIEPKYLPRACRDAQVERL